MTRWLAIVALTGCLRTPAGYPCTTDTQCVRGGVAGKCESVGYCSFPDPSCVGGSRFAPSGGPYSSQCVAADAGVQTDGPPATNQPRFLASAYAQATTAPTLTFPLTIPPDTDLFLVVSVETAGNGTIAGITYDGAPLAFLDYVVGVPDDGTTRSEQWTLIAPVTGANDVVITLDNVGTRIHGNAMAFANVSQTVPVFGVEKDSSGKSAIGSVTLPSTASCLIESTTGASDTIVAPGNGQTLRFYDPDDTDPATTNSHVAGSTAPGVDGMVTMVWDYNATDAADDWQVMTVALQAP